MIHIHANGKVDDEPAYLALVRGQIAFLHASRESLEVRVLYGTALPLRHLR
ncbi:hypothetical protein MNJPNG_08910 [Cupriavidus oxalaticus]|uniref:hypothetical protein n=1 Tax=Cupriavidus oxalaticus TaxID=96344 RepID=UPI003F73A4D8